MPELGPPKNFAIDINKAREIKNLNKNWKAISEQYNRNKIGSGAESFVVEHEDKNKVFAISKYYRDIKDAKRTFYSNKVMKILFPYNFPRMYASFSPGEDNISQLDGTVREKIVGKKGDKQSLIKRAKREFLLTSSVIGTFLSKEYNPKAEGGHPFSSVNKTLSKLGIRPFTSIDVNDCNFITDENKNEYYVDMAPIYHISDETKDKIIEYMRENRYSESSIQAASNAIKRLQEINNN